MGINNLGDSVGKKIVDALKTQEEIEESTNNYIAEPEISEPDINTINGMFKNGYAHDSNIASDSIISSDVEQIFQQNLNSVSNSQTFAYEYPANVAILNNLIAKLPVGVSKQTGALIIRQTMEALGIPMSNVIQEAKQVQEDLARKASECQQNIINYKKQINVLEMQSMQFQKQAVSMNDIISLFKN